MKTAERVFLIALNFLMPPVLIILMIFMNFFMYGSGASSTLLYEKYKAVWIGSYLLLGLINLLLLYRYLKFSKPVFRILLCISLAALYGYYLTEF